MSQRNIHIENLKIRLSKNSGLSARDIASGLGDEILRQIAETTRHRTGTRRIDSLDAGTIKNSGGATAAHLQRQIARRIAAGIDEKSGKRED
jgi:hypothetical protein